MFCACLKSVCSPIHAFDPFDVSLVPVIFSCRHCFKTFFLLVDSKIQNKKVKSRQLLRSLFKGALHRSVILFRKVLLLQTTLWCLLLLWSFMESEEIALMMSGLLFGDSKVLGLWKMWAFSRHWGSNRTRLLGCFLGIVWSTRDNKSEHLRFTELNIFFYMYKYVYIIFKSKSLDYKCLKVYIVLWKKKCLQYKTAIWIHTVATIAVTTVLNLAPLESIKKWFCSRIVYKLSTRPMSQYVST